MAKENEVMIDGLTKLMEGSGCVINPPLSVEFLESMMEGNSLKSYLSFEFEGVNSDIVTLLKNQPDYLNFLKRMDGFEFDGLILYSFSVQNEGDDVPANNIFLYNDNFRNNDIYVNPDLSERVVIGQDSISFFTYDLKDNVYQIRDNVASGSVYGSFDNFYDFLKEILDTVK